MASLDVCGLEPFPSQHKLTGSTGTSAANPYWFSHVSAVASHDDRPSNDYLYLIPNHHPHSDLPIRWLGSHGAEFVEFEEVRVGGCAANIVPDGRPFVEDSMGRVEYAPLLQRRKNAPAYRPSDGFLPLISQDGVELRSLVFAELTVQEVERTTHIEVATEFRDGMIVNTIVNLGSQDELFRVPALTSALTQMQALAQVTIQEDWPRIEELFMAPATGEPNLQLFTVAEGAVLQAMPVRVEILSDDESVLVRAQVTLHMPIVPGEV